MSETPNTNHEPRQSIFGKLVGSMENRKLRANASPSKNVWFGLGMMGLIGWSVVAPTLLGAGIGVWLDNSHDSHSWTLSLMGIGLALGCLNAWNWVRKEDDQIRKAQGDSQ